MYSYCVPGEGGRGVIPYIGHIGVCGAKEYGFFFIFFGLKKVSISTSLVWVCFLEETTSSSLGDKTISLWVLGQPGTFRNSTVLYSFVSYLIKAYQHCL